ncbi:MAG TPA: AMP-binding protein [Gammaproteobacteria bacterium]|nr:AMP-binding protein [Gammaproteobacteria bacterium]
MQYERLRNLVTGLHANPFYKRKLEEAGVKAEDIDSLDALAQLPFTTKSELLASQLESPPFGDLLSHPLSEYTYFHQTSGTTGKPLKWLDTEESWQGWTECWQYVYTGAGVTSDDIVYLPFSFGPYISHWIAIDGARRLGALCISGAGMSSERRLEMILDNRCTVLVCTPTYALRLAEVAREQQIDIRGSNIRTLINAGEPGANVPNVKRAIETAWGARCYDHVGATEVGAWGFTCQADGAGMHLNEHDFVFEVIDPESTQPAAEGERGELVITNFGRQCMPLLRYRTGDLVELTNEGCACGRTFARIKGGVLGRADDMFVVRGVNLYPSAIDNLIRALPEIVEYEVNIQRIRGMDALTIRVETNGDTDFDQAEARILAAFRDTFNIGVSVAEAAAGSLPRYELKARRYKRID